LVSMPSILTVISALVRSRVKKTLAAPLWPALVRSSRVGDGGSDWNWAGTELGVSDSSPPAEQLDCTDCLLFRVFF
jgi:hypothetical protein